jgi:OOP family OmpA-OmpF porin
MQLKLNKFSLGMAASLVLLTAPSAVFAQDERFVQCTSGVAVRDSQGECVLAAGGEPLPECLPAAEAPPPTVTAASLGADAFFDFDRSELKPEGRARIEQLVRDMAQVNVQSVDIVGHTDSIGTEEYNQALSERRAQSTADYMADQGIDRGLIATRGMGELQPVAPNRNPDGSDNPEGRAQNRRVDITVVAQQSQ